MLGWFLNTPSAPAVAVQGWFDAADVEPEVDVGPGWFIDTPES